MVDDKKGEQAFNDATPAPQKRKCQYMKNTLLQGESTVYRTRDICVEDEEKVEQA